MPQLRTVRLGNTDIETTALGFGCADLFREPSSARRLRLLNVAFDAGVRHFDVAPMYGLGRVETELGRFARGKRDQIMIATKFGIDPAPVGRLLGGIQGSIHRVLRTLPMVADRPRAAGEDPRSGWLGALLYRPSDYRVRTARASLERSLRQLQTDNVDMLFLHDPTPGAAISDDIGAYLESARSAGHIRAWGIAGEPASTEFVAQQLNRPVPILQVRGDVFSRMSGRIVTGGDQGLILFAVIARALPRVLFHVRSDAQVRRRWNDAIGADCGDAEEMATLLLRDALCANIEGTVLFSTIQAGRIKTAAFAARDAMTADGAVDAFRTLVKAELAGLQRQL
jgi:D-threo-aldose 1-dehydrogenase